MGSVDSPRLEHTAFFGPDLNKRLDESARRFVNGPKRVEYDRDTGHLRISRLFEWYAKEFQAAKDGLVGFLNRFRSEQIPAGAKVEWMEFDWTTDDVK